MNVVLVRVQANSNISSEHLADDFGKFRCKHIASVEVRGTTPKVSRIVGAADRRIVSLRTKAAVDIDRLTDFVANLLERFDDLLLHKDGAVVTAVELSDLEVLRELDILVLRIEVAHNILNNVSHLLNLPCKFVVFANDVMPASWAETGAEFPVFQPPLKAPEKCFQFSQLNSSLCSENRKR